MAACACLRRCSARRGQPTQTSTSKISTLLLFCTIDARFPKPMCLRSWGGISFFTFPWHCLQEIFPHLTSWKSLPSFCFLCLVRNPWVRCSFSSMLRRPFALRAPWMLRRVLFFLTASRPSWHENQNGREKIRVLYEISTKEAWARTCTERGRERDRERERHRHIERDREKDIKMQREETREKRERERFRV